jgi:hypothetical protein
MSRSRRCRADASPEDVAAAEQPQSQRDALPLRHGLHRPHQNGRCASSDPPFRGLRAQAHAEPGGSLCPAALGKSMFVQTSASRVRAAPSFSPAASSAASASRAQRALAAPEEACSSRIKASGKRGGASRSQSAARVPQRSACSWTRASRSSRASAWRPMPLTRRAMRQRSARPGTPPRPTPPLLLRSTVALSD